MHNLYLQSAKTIAQHGIKGTLIHLLRWQFWLKPWIINYNIYGSKTVIETTIDTCDLTFLSSVSGISFQPAKIIITVLLSWPAPLSTAPLAFMAFEDFLKLAIHLGRCATMQWMYSWELGSRLFLAWHLKETLLFISKSLTFPVWTWRAETIPYRDWNFS